MIYQPSDDSYLLEEQVKNLSQGKSVLDMGAGSGLLALAALNSGAESVLAADINLEVIELLKSKNISCINSDLFSNISNKFDLIIFNPPYLPQDSKEPKDSQLATTGGPKGDEIILHFLQDLSNHLNPSGFCLLLLSSLTPKDKILKTLKDKDLTHKIISQKNLFQEKLEVWHIQKL